MTKIIYIIRGLPGTGKSTLARLLAPPKNHCETDAYFVTDGQYKFDPTATKQAHAWCEEQARALLQAGESPVTVSNTFTEKWEYQPYLAMAHKHKYAPCVLEIFGPWKNQHDVPAATIREMQARWQCHNHFEEDTMAQIEAMAALQFTPEQIAVIVEIERPDLDAPDGERAFYRGRLKAQAEVRAQIKQLAIQGSTPAQREFLALVEKTAYLDHTDDTD